MYETWLRENGIEEVKDLGIKDNNPNVEYIDN